MPTITLTPYTPWEHRSAVYGGRSTCGAWKYYLTNGRCEVTHEPTGRRFWALDIERARKATADTAFVTELLAAPPAGKPLAKAEYAAILGELTGADTRQMILACDDGAVDVVADALERVRPGTPVYLLHAVDAVNVLGIVYGRAPGAWLEALRRVRPDLVPARHRES